MPATETTAPTTKALHTAARLLMTAEATRGLGVFRTAQTVVTQFMDFVALAGSQDAEAKAKAFMMLQAGEIAPSPAPERLKSWAEMMMLTAHGEIVRLHQASQEERLKIAATIGNGLIGISHRYVTQENHLRLINGQEVIVPGPKLVENRTRYFVADIQSACELAIGQLAEMITRHPKDPRGREILCRCQIEECQRFFLAFRVKGADQKLGLPQRAYCNDEHRKLGQLRTRRRWNRDHQSARKRKTSTKRKPK